MPEERIQPPLLETSALVDYAKTLDCIHCGLCLQTCPTYRLSGVETSSPRGRIHLMRAVGEDRLQPDASYDEELDFCLLCRHCESVCPAGVPFGQMMETARHARFREKRIGWLARLALDRVLGSRLLLRLAGSLLRTAQMLRLEGLAARLAGTDPDSLRKLPRVPALPARPLLPRHAPTDTERKGTVDVLQGCVQAELFSHVNRATLRSLTWLGYDVSVPPALTCCGSLHAHNGDREGARRLAHELIRCLEQEGGNGDGDGDRPLIVNSAGCGSHLKELHELFAPDDPWHERARRVAARVRDYTEFVAPLLEEREDLGLPAGLLEAPFAWDDPCHLCHGQGLRAQPRSILGRVLGKDLVPMEDSEACCGSAGVYSMVRPLDAQRVFEDKREAFERSGARTLVTANPGCQLQWSAGLEEAAGTGTPRVVHIAEIVEAALVEGRRASGA